MEIGRIRNVVQGKVVENHEGEHLHPLIGVNVYWQDTQVGTTTDVDGYIFFQTIFQCNQRYQ